MLALKKQRDKQMKVFWSLQKELTNTTEKLKVGASLSNER